MYTIEERIADTESFQTFVTDAKVLRVHSLTGQLFYVEREEGCAMPRLLSVNGFAQVTTRRPNTFNCQEIITI